MPNDSRASSEPPALPLTPELWRLSRLSLDYLLDQIEISRGGGDVVDRLLLAAILDANLGPIKQDPVLQFAYGGLEAPPPEALRRPVSVMAISESLAIPYETTRRRIARLTRQGACLAVAGGVLVPQAALESPAFKAMSLARYARLRRFHGHLAAAGVLPPSELGAAGAGPFLAMGGEAPVRVVNRLLAEHLMRFIEGVTRRIPDPLAGLLLLAVARWNTAHLGSQAEVPLAEHLRPVGIPFLARRLNMPAETLRRRAVALERLGCCERTRQGLVASTPGLRRPDVLALIGENAANVQRLFVRLDRIGALAAWDAEKAEARW